MSGQLIRALRRAKEAGLELEDLRADNPDLAAVLTGVPFVVDARDVAGTRKYRRPLTRVGPVCSGSLREYDEGS